MIPAPKGGFAPHAKGAVRFAWLLAAPCASAHLPNQDPSPESSNHHHDSGPPYIPGYLMLPTNCAMSLSSWRFM